MCRYCVCEALVVDRRHTWRGVVRLATALPTRIRFRVVYAGQEREEVGRWRRAAQAPGGGRTRNDGAVERSAADAARWSLGITSIDVLATVPAGCPGLTAICSASGSISLLPAFLRIAGVLATAATNVREQCSALGESGILCLTAVFAAVGIRWVGNMDCDTALRSIAGSAPRTLIDDSHDLRTRRCLTSHATVNTLA